MMNKNTLDDNYWSPSDNGICNYDFTFDGGLMNIDKFRLFIREYKENEPAFINDLTVNGVDSEGNLVELF